MSQEKFSIGLILAEIVSAGAYTAGVLDFLIEALDEWHRLKADAPQEVPSHDVELKVVTGASGGAINGAILGVSLKSDVLPHRQ